jgi:SAM-dependent methyltransferase
VAVRASHTHSDYSTTIFPMSSAEDLARAGAAAGHAREAVQRARHAATTARQAAASRARSTEDERKLFAQPVQDYLHQALGRPLNVLRAGTRTPIGELGLSRLRDNGYQITVTTVDQDTPLTQAVLTRAVLARDELARDVIADPAASAAASAGPGPVLLGDLRSVPLPPRSFDIVYCGFLLEHIQNAALVLDRFVAALRPGGLLLLRVRDRDCAAAVLDRKVPEPLRRALWARLHPGEPGPFPAVYEPLASARGLQAYAAAHGLVIARREAGRSVPAAPARLSAAVQAARKLVAGLTRDRCTDAHDELLYVIRKPEDRFARLV